MAMPQVTYVCYREFRITMDYTFCFPHLYNYIGVAISFDIRRLEIK